MQWLVTQPVVIKAWGRAQHGMPLCSEILQLVAKLDGAGAELDGPTPDRDRCATASGGSVLRCTAIGRTSSSSTSTNTSSISTSTSTNSSTASGGSLLPGSVLPWEYTRGGGSCFTHGVGATRVRRCCSAGAWTEPSHANLGHPASWRGMLGQ